MIIFFFVGGVYGSLMGTPILNPPQSAILGMHGIFKRPVVVDGQVSIVLMSRRFVFMFSASPVTRWSFVQ